MRFIKWICGLAVLACLTFLLLRGFASAKEWVKVSAPSRPIAWFVIQDLSDSPRTTVGADWFSTCQKRMIPAVVLCRLQPRDEVFLAPLDDRTDDGQTRYFNLRVRQDLAGVGPQIGKIRDELWSWKMRNPRQHTGSDFGGAVRWVAANVKRIKAERGNQAPRFVALIFTDGYADGWQAPTGGDKIPSEVELSIWGTARRDMHKRLAEVLKAAGVELARVRHIPFGDWESVAPTFGTRHSRPQNEHLLTLLESGQEITPRNLLKVGAF